MNKRILILIVPCLLACIHCAGTMRPVTYQTRSLIDADSLFRGGNYAEAKLRYQRIRSSRPNSPDARAAHFQLAYINVFYKNPHANWNKALDEFKSFAALYPNDSRIHEAFSWIRLLTVIKSFDAEFNRAASQVGKLRDDQNQERITQKLILESIETMLQNCYRSHDTLIRKNAELENVILDLEKKCQQAGR